MKQAKNQVPIQNARTYIPEYKIAPLLCRKIDFSMFIAVRTVIVPTAYNIFLINNLGIT